jgi:CMP-N-acetylneuraminic acid synthetase
MEVIHYELAQAVAEGFNAEAILLVQPTSPLLSFEDLEAAWALFAEGASCVVGMVQVDHPIQWTWSRNAEGFLTPLIDSPEASRRQDFREGFRPAGFYLAKPEFIRTHNSFFVSDFTHSVVVPRERAIDIDCESDLWMADGLLRRGGMITGGKS